MGICASKPQVESAAEQAQAAAQEPSVSAFEGHVKAVSATDVKVNVSNQAAEHAGSQPNGCTEILSTPASTAEASAGSSTASPVPEPGGAASITPTATAAVAAAGSAAAAGAALVCAGDDDEQEQRAKSAPPAASAQVLPGDSRVAAASSPQAPASVATTGSGADAAAAVAAANMPATAPEAVLVLQQPAAGAVDTSLPCTAQAPNTGSCNIQGSQSVQSALASGVSSKASLPPRSVKFAEQQAGSSADVAAAPAPQPGRVSWGGSSSSNGASGGLDQPPRPRGRIPGRSQSSLNPRARSDGGQMSEAVLAKQADILRANKMGKLRQRRGGLDSSFAAMQEALATGEKSLAHVNTRAAGLKHIGFGPFKRENQDEFFIQVGEFGGLHSSNLFCVFDGHGTHGKDAALYSRQLLPRLLDVEMTKYFQRVNTDSDDGLKGAVEVLITEVFGETERSLSQFGVNLASSGTTASVAYQQGNRLWVASAGDSRAILCSRVRDQWRALPLTIDHRPRRDSERERIEAAGARVAPKRLPSGRTVGEPRLWLQNAHGPGLLLSRSLGDLTAATVGCTSDPEVSFTTLRPGVDHVLVMASDGVWDVLTNEQVCDIVVESPDPHIACRRVLDAALYEWEERMSADNITVLVVEFDWGEEGSLSVNSMDVAALASSSSNRVEDMAAPEAAGVAPALASPGMA